MRKRKTTRSCFLFLSVLRCFTSRGTPLFVKKRYPLEVDEFPHSETSGSKAINRLPEAFRWLIASFIATLSQGIHRAPFMFLCGIMNTTIIFLAISCHAQKRLVVVTWQITYIYSSVKGRMFLKRENRHNGGFPCARMRAGLTASFFEGFQVRKHV